MEAFVGGVDKHIEEFWDGKRSATDRLRRPSPLKDSSRSRQRTKPHVEEARMREVFDRDNPRPIPAMPIVPTSSRHRPRDNVFLFPACVARPVSKNE
eukprot:10797147-Lingulodinium_polyedra.AAC.1